MPENWGVDGSIAPQTTEELKNVQYVVDWMIQGKQNMARTFLQAPTLLSLIGVATAFVAANIQQIYGYNAYLPTDPKCKHLDPNTCKDLRLIAHVPVMDVMAMIAAPLKEAAGRQVLTAAVPIINPSSQEFQAMVDEARKRGVTQ